MANKGIKRNLNNELSKDSSGDESSERSLSGSDADEALGKDQESQESDDQEDQSEEEEDKATDNDDAEAEADEEEEEEEADEPSPKKQRTKEPPNQQDPSVPGPSTSTAREKIVEAESKLPTTKEMIIQAVRELNKKKGSTPYAIKKYINNNFAVNQYRKKIVSKLLKSAHIEGWLIQVKGTGATSGSYFKLPNPEKKRLIKKKKVTTEKQTVRMKKSDKSTEKEKKIKKPRDTKEKMEKEQKKSTKVKGVSEKKTLVKPKETKKKGKQTSGE